MILVKEIVSLSVLGLLLGCASDPMRLTEDGAKIKTLTQSEVSYSCTKMSDVTIANRSCYNVLAHIKTELINKAALEGATHVYIETISICGGSGLAFKCPTTFMMATASRKKMCSTVTPMHIDAGFNQIDTDDS